MRVWIDQDQCTGSGMCEDATPDVFFLDDDLAYVKEDGAIFGETKMFSPRYALPAGMAGQARVPAGQEEAVLEASKDCPGECIFILVDD